MRAFAPNLDVKQHTAMTIECSIANTMSLLSRKPVIFCLVWLSNDIDSSDPKLVKLRAPKFRQEANNIKATLRVVGIKQSKYTPD